MFDFDDEDFSSKTVKLEDVRLSLPDLWNLQMKGTKDYDRQSAQSTGEELFKAKSYLNGKGDQGMKQLELFAKLHFSGYSDNCYSLNVRDGRWYWRERGEGCSMGSLLSNFERTFGTSLKAPQGTQTRFTAGIEYCATIRETCC